MGTVTNLLLASCLLVGPVSPHGVTESLQQNSNLPEYQQRYVEEEQKSVIEDCFVDTTQKLLDQSKSTQEQFSTRKEQLIKEQEQKEYEKLTKRFKKGLNSVPSPGVNLCAMYVSMVYQVCGYKYPGGNANDMYYKYCDKDISEIKNGMIIAVPSWNGDYMAQTYGHVGIYMNGKIWHNIGYIERISIDKWVQTYGQISEVKCGYAF